MIEVQGMMDEEAPLLVTFDGKFLEIFYRSGMKFQYTKYPIQWIEKMEIKNLGGRTLTYTMKYEAPVGFFTFISGGENLDELVNTVNAAINAF